MKMRRHPAAHIPYSLAYYQEVKTRLGTNPSSDYLQFNKRPLLKNTKIFSIKALQLEPLINKHLL